MAWSQTDRQTDNTCVYEAAKLVYWAPCDAELRASSAFAHAACRHAVLSSPSAREAAFLNAINETYLLYYGLL